MFSPSPLPPWPSLVVKKGSKMRRTWSSGNAVAVIADREANLALLGWLARRMMLPVRRPSKACRTALLTKLVMIWPSGPEAVHHDPLRDIDGDRVWRLAHRRRQRGEYFADDLGEVEGAPLVAGLVDRHLLEAGDQVARAWLRLRSRGRWRYVPNRGIRSGRIASGFPRRPFRRIRWSCHAACWRR